MMNVETPQLLPSHKEELALYTALLLSVSFAPLAAGPADTWQRGVIYS